MLSYQHMYHAGNRADVHKHALLAALLAYLVRKPKPLTYIETHAGRGLYDLGTAEARLTGEAAAGIGRLAARLDPASPYARVLARVRAASGPGAYPGSPLIAASLLRPGDRIELAELHPAERAALTGALSGRATIHASDGFALARALVPPQPRRGLLLCDPSFEIKGDYTTIPAFFAEIARKWNVGILALWYPLLPAAAHLPMLAALRARFPEALTSECRFAQIRPGKGILGSGMFVVNPPWGLAEAARRIEALVAQP